LSYEHEILGNDEISIQIRNSNAKDFNLSGEFEPTSLLMQILEIDDVLEEKASPSTSDALAAMKAKMKGDKPAE
jgi:hypothetical protein